MDRLCKALFLSYSAREQDDNLIFVRERMLRSADDRTALLDLYRKVRTGAPVPADEGDERIETLRLAGITRVQRGRLVVRNRLYKRVFDLKWVQDHMPDAELRRQKAAYWRGVARASSIGVAILSAMLALAVVAMGNAQLARVAERKESTARRAAEQEKDRARAAERKALLLLYDADIQLAYRSLQTQDTAVAIRILQEHIPSWGTEDLRDFGWRLLWNEVEHDCVRPVSSRRLAPLDATFAPDGTLVTLGSMGDLERWDAYGSRVGSPLRVSLGGARWANLIDGGCGAAVFAHGDLSLLDTASGRRLTVHTGAIPTAVTTDGSRAAALARDGSCRVYNLKDGSSRTFPDISIFAALSPHGRYLLGTSAMGRPVVVDLARGAGGGRREFAVDGTATALATSNDERQLAVGEFSGQIRLYDLASGTLRARCPMAGTAPDRLVFSPDGSLLMARYADGLVAVWDTRSGTLKDVLGQEHPRESVLLFSPDGQRVAASSRSLGVRIWRLASGPAANPEPCLQGCQPTHVAYSPDGTQIAVSGVSTANGAGMGAYPAQIRPCVWLFDAATGRLERTFAHQGGAAWTAAFSPDGEKLAAGTVFVPRRPTSIAVQARVTLWDLHTGRVCQELQGDPRGPMAGISKRSGVGALAYSSDGKLLAAGSGQPENVHATDTAVTIWNSAGRRLATLTGSRAAISSVMFTNGNQELIATSLDGSTRVWNTAGWRLVSTTQSAHPVFCASPMPGTTALAEGSTDGEITIWDWKTDRILQQFKVFPSVCASLAVSTDGQTLATTNEAGAVRLWDLRSGRGTLSWNENGECRLAFAPDGRGLAAAESGSLHLFRASSPFVPSSKATAIDATDLHLFTGGAARASMVWPPRGNARPASESGRASAGNSIQILAADGHAEDVRLAFSVPPPDVVEDPGTWRVIRFQMRASCTREVWCGTGDFSAGRSFQVSPDWREFRIVIPSALRGGAAVQEAAFMLGQSPGWVQVRGVRVQTQRTDQALPVPSARPAALGFRATPIGLSAGGVCQYDRRTGAFSLLSRGASGSAASSDSLFVFHPANENFTLTCRVTADSKSSGLAGLMVRTTGNIDAPYLLFGVRPGGHFVAESSVAARSADLVCEGPVWLRIRRQGDQMHGEYSRSPHGPFREYVQIPYSGPTEVGMLTRSEDWGHSFRARFDSLRWETSGG